MTVGVKITNGDATVDERGQVVFVSGSAKLAQDLTQNMLQETNDDGFGAGLDGLIGYVPRGEDFVTALMARRIYSAVAAHIALQDVQQSQRSATEQIARIRFLSVNQRANDPMTYDYRLEVLSRAGVVTPLAFAMSTEFNPVTTPGGSST